MKYLYDPPALIKKIFSSTHWNTSNNKILLTFDDGPLEGNTEKILEELKKYNIKALFFCVGNNIEKNKEITKFILAHNHTIGNHTFNHKRITGFNDIEWEHEVNKVTELMANEFNYDIKYFRPPYGSLNFKSAKRLTKLKLQNVMWSLLTYDYKNNPDIVKFAINKYIRKDSIIVMHDNKKCRDIIIDSIRYVIDFALEKGFQFGEPEECLK